MLNLLHKGSVLTGQEDKLQAVWEHFSLVLGSRAQRGCCINFAALGISPIDLSSIDGPFTEDEVRAAVMDMNPRKAPGPDGYTALFFQKCWDIIKNDMMTAIKAFEGLNTARLASLNNATMILIKKRADATEAKDYRPISLLTFFAKLIMKILALRLQPRLKELVLPSQSAFIKGRAIHDNFMFVRGMVRSLYLKKIPSIMLKLDIDKAFDSVSWEFLLEVLAAKGFSQTWRNWIASMLASSSTRVLVNGELTDKIMHRKGLRQGDPLSPLLFVLVMDTLDALMRAAVTAQVLPTFGRNLPTIRASLYADDVMIFVKPNTQEVSAVKKILDVFGNATGLWTNFLKSSFCHIRCDNINIHELAMILQCPIKEFPVTYLGMPLSYLRLKKIHYQPIFDKLKRNTSGWNKLMLPTAGRLALITSVLYALPIFQILAIEPPRWVVKKFDKGCRGFLWANKDEATGGKCLVNWKQVCLPKKLGGLGIPCLTQKSEAMRCRWLWLSWMEPDRPWHGLPLPINSAVRALFEASVEIIIGNGANTKFWTDPWHERKSFSRRFPQLFSQCTIKAISVKSALADEKWMRHFKGILTQEAIAQFMTLWNDMQQIQLTQSRDDSLIWRWTSDGQFSSSSAFAATLTANIKPPFAKLAWGSDAPPKCQFFVWLAAQERCLTADNLAKRGWPHNLQCVLCLQEPETAAHLLASCSYAQEIWHLTLCKLNMSTALAAADDDSLVSWWQRSSSSMGKEQAKSWRSILALVWWNLWKERNERIFKNNSSRPCQLFQNLRQRIGWMLDASERWPL